MTNLNQVVSSLTEKVNRVIDASNAQNDFLKTVAYKSFDLEARARRNNLIFRGFAENYGENCLQILQDFLRNRLDIDPN